MESFQTPPVISHEKQEPPGGNRYLIMTLEDTHTELKNLVSLASVLSDALGLHDRPFEGAATILEERLWNLYNRVTKFIEDEDVN